MENVRPTRRKQQHLNLMQSPLLLMASGGNNAEVTAGHSTWEYLRKRHYRPSHSSEREVVLPAAKTKPSMLRSCKRTQISNDCFQKGDVPYGNSVTLPQLKTSPTSCHRSTINDPSTEDGMITDCFEPLSISKWLLSMKSPLTPLSPRSDSNEKLPGKSTQTGTRDNIPSWLQTMKLPIAPLSPTDVSTSQNVLYPVWVPQGMSGVETVLPDSPSAPVALITKPMPEIVPSPAQSTAPEDLRNSTRPPPTVVVVPNETSYTELCHVQDYSSNGSPRLCNLVTHRSNDPSNGPLIAADKVEPDIDSSGNTEEERSDRTKKKTRVTIEIETGGECVIFLPADRVEYRVVARKCPHCNDDRENVVIPSRKPVVTVEPKAKTLN